MIKQLAHAVAYLHDQCMYYRHDAFLIFITCLYMYQFVHILKQNRQISNRNTILSFGLQKFVRSLIQVYRHECKGSKGIHVFVKGPLKKARKFG